MKGRAHLIFMNWFFVSALLYTPAGMSALASNTEDLKSIPRALTSKSEAKKSDNKNSFAEACADCTESSRYQISRTAEDCGSFKATLSTCAEYVKALSGASSK